VQIHDEPSSRYPGNVTSLAYLFASSLLLTLILLTCLAIAGLKGKRRRHVTLFFPTAAFLLVTVYLAEKLGEIYRFSPRVLSLHVPLAASCLLMLLPVIGTGIWRYRRPARMWPHRCAVIVFLILAFLAMATGILLVLTPHDLSSAAN
jgi:hypothetical protein